MKKNSTPLGDIIRSVKVNVGLVIGLAVILVIAAYIYIPTVKQELGAKPSEAFDAFDLGGSLPGDSGIPIPGGDPVPWNWPPAGPDDPWGPEGEETQLTLPISGWPKIHNNKVAFTAGTDPDMYYMDVYVWDLVTESYTIVCTGHWHKSFLGIYDNQVIWLDKRGNHTNNLYMYDLITQTETQVSDNLYIPSVIQELNSNPAIYGNKIAWRKRVYDKISPENNHQLIMLYTIDTGATEVVATIEGMSDYDIDSGLDIYENIIVWSATDKESGLNHIYMYNIDNPGEPPEQLTFSTTGSQRTPAIYGSYIVWEDLTPLFRGIHFYNLETGEENNIGQDYTVINKRPAIYRDVIVWDARTGCASQPDIYMHRISDPLGTNYQITTNEAAQIRPDVFANKIVWMDYRDGDSSTFTNPDIYMFEWTN